MLLLVLMMVFFIFQISTQKFYVFQVLNLVGYHLKNRNSKNAINLK